MFSIFYIPNLIYYVIITGLKRKSPEPEREDDIIFVPPSPPIVIEDNSESDNE